MMSNRTKALFYDIDGTLLSEKTGRVPDSAREALREARKRGHLVFINTGRVYFYLDEIRAQVEADGFLCGCGTCIVMDGKILYRHRIPRERCLEIKRDLERCRVDGILEATEGIYFHQYASRIPHIEKLKMEIRKGGGEGKYRWEDDEADFDKFCVGTDEESLVPEMLGCLKDMEVIDRGNGFYEAIPRGHSKATAIDLALKHCGISRDDAYVFGDSSNDLSMFQFAKNCILMGKHSPVLEPYATFETKTVEEDGIAYAMKELGLI